MPASRVAPAARTPEAAVRGERGSRNTRSNGVAGPCSQLTASDWITALAAAKGGQVLLDLVGGTFVHLDQGDLLGIARQRLQPQAAAAGKQIQTAGATDMRSQPVEDGLLDAIRGGSESFHIPDRQFAASPLTADDSYKARFPLRGWALARAVTAGFHSGHRVSSSENKVVV